MVNTFYDLQDNTVLNYIYKKSDDMYVSSVRQNNNDINSQDEISFFIAKRMKKITTEYKNKQSTGLEIERFGIHSEVCSSDTSLDFPYITISSREKSSLMCKIQHCYFEPGIWTEADEYFELLAKKYNGLEKPLMLLSDITNHNLASEHVLEGVLHILSSYAYEEVSPFGITIALACTVNHSPVIQDRLISCFETWNSVDAIEILESLSFDKIWLKEYRDEVLSQLKSKCEIA